MKYEIDSRKIKPGQTFVALKGHTVDGHDYILDAIKNGASKVVAEKKVQCSVPLEIVPSTEEYLKEVSIYIPKTSDVQIYVNVNNDDILNFSNILNQTIVNIKQENKVNTMLDLANLYGYIPNYLKQFSNDEEKISIEYIKSNILNSYALVEQERWDEVKEQVFNSVENITNIMNSINTEQFSQYQINRIYVMLNELYSSIDLKDKQLYYIKYRNVMEELMNI